MKKVKYSSGAEWEDIAGYSRAIKIGKTIEVSGTTSVRGGAVVGQGDMYIQAKTILSIIEKAIHNLGGSMEDVVRTRMYVTDIGKWELAAKAHGEVFSLIKPTTTMVEISALINPEMLIEIEATAVIE